ncbi:MULTISPECIES: hypothetical protein [unclassified Undibacterium]|uniref:hypothetical protein n=1 Tax=unclassified Undibacterium TaxID=2630295 RepID=UPI002AC8CEEB|nr:MULTISPECIES: hypothetical protein [unclassified Undibacterium]MEB0138101.1 hypothetical protein [Undibacterium sp. CCC2.1]MEB0171144.1 hypothetical protein [Undibacterium sp. CCC1.1]MEB0175189.1 hypothetical protein [Undibacterium sp. CCC3.4]MEB0214226.1 hypothetical protein [Undibacterium sp. 5I2]WPX41808.1 hypothetical protein RHM61_10285 [Undibacterium sp. CCC3.4]
MENPVQPLPAPLVYVSITGLRVNSSWHYLRFAWFAVRSMTQAQRSPGLIRVAARKINGVHHTYSVWEDEAAMRRFLVVGAHLQAMRAFKHIASGKTVGFLTSEPPDWSQVHEIWLREGVDR